jgi:hypothetical protein
MAELWEFDIFESLLFAEIVVKAQSENDDGDRKKNRRAACKTQRGGISASTPDRRSMNAAVRSPGAA